LPRARRRNPLQLAAPFLRNLNTDRDRVDNLRRCDVSRQQSRRTAGGVAYSRGGRDDAHELLEDRIRSMRRRASGVRKLATT
jgi:hypothetical protein